MIRIGLIIASFAVFALSCSFDLETINKIIDAETEPDLTFENFETLHFDSARLQMRMISPVVKQFSSASEQRQEFPEGLHVWLYENSGEVSTEITAKWAKRNLETNIWEARDSVVVINADGRVLETEQLFWDANEAILYSERYTKITQSDGSWASGNSFRALQDFSRYTLDNSSGIGRTVIYVRDEENDLDEEN